MTTPALPEALARRQWGPWVTGALATLVAGWIGWQIAVWPDVAALGDQHPESTAFIERYRREQRALGRSDAVQWVWEPYERISAHLKRAVVAAEDMEFFFHHGFSSAELRDALTKALRKLEAPRGASTITQQLAKNLWLSPSRDPLRKLKEAILTKQLERHLSKRRILELYLNVAEFGQGVYGAEAAARHYFEKPAAELTEHEAAELAASLPRPSTWHPGRDSGPYRRYVAEIERRMGVATFLWRAMGAEPEVATPQVAINVDSLLQLLRDTVGQMIPDTSAAPADSKSAAERREDQDSVLAVRAALNALLAAYPELETYPMVVVSFARDTAGVLVELVRGASRETAISSGGGLVRVWKGGTATIVRVRQ